MTTTASALSSPSSSLSRAMSSRSYSARSSRPPPAASAGIASAAAHPSVHASGTVSTDPHSSRPLPQPQRHLHRRTSSSTRSIQDVLPEHDYETSNLVARPRRSSSRDCDRARDRDGERDRARLPSPSRGADPSRQPRRRTSTRSAHHHRQSHDQADMQPSTVTGNGNGNGIGSGNGNGNDNRSFSGAFHRAAPRGRHDATQHSARTQPQPQSQSLAKQTRSRTLIPTQSGKWILGKTIGAGSMGKVKLTRKEDGSEQVACKIVPRGSVDDGQQSRADRERADQLKEIRTAREATIVTLLNHPHICAMRDVVRTNFHWYMLFEYVNGGQMLDYIISHGKLKDKQARKFGRQIASALDYCHRNSIVHRDLKIENILISKNGDIKIIDFGLSNLFAPQTHLKTFCGSLYFAAPELLQARAYTGPEVDVWSFGIVLYVLVCGKVPFDDQSMPALHAKIKKGLVDYPSWLSNECKHLLARMLMTDPKQRASMQEVMSHPWMVKGFNGPPDNHLPHREPLSPPLDSEVILAMQGFSFGSPDSIKTQLLNLIESDEYRQAVHAHLRERETLQPSRDVEKRRGFGFDFYKRRSSTTSRDTLTVSSSEALQLGADPLYAFSPLLSVYYLVKEKQEREQGDLSTSGATVRDRAKDKESERKTGPEAAFDLAPPQAAHTNAAAFEMPGEKPTGGRSRPRARTHGEDDASEVLKQTRVLPTPPEPRVEQLQRKEGTAAGLLRRFSTRKRREPERADRDINPPPTVQVHSPAQSTPVTPKKSFSIRRGRQYRDDPATPSLRSAESQAQHGELLSPPLAATGSRPSRKGGLDRSASVNSAEVRRSRDPNRLAKEPPATSGSEQSVPHGEATTSQRPHLVSRSTNSRAKSLGHARRESIQRRRRLREGLLEANVPKETDLEQEQSGVSTEKLDSSDLAKPVFLKGLFSVSTTSGKSVPVIRSDIKRVLDQLNVDYTEIKGGFSCKYAPSIDLNKIHDPPGSPAQTPAYRRRFSLGGLMRGDDRERDEVRDTDRERPSATPRTIGRSERDRSDSNFESSVDSIPRRVGHVRRAPGETSTQVQSDLGGSMIMEFEIFIVKVPLLSLYGIQFKRMTGNTWQYKNMADQILKELKL